MILENGNSILFDTLGDLEAYEKAFNVKGFKIEVVII